MGLKRWLVWSVVALSVLAHVSAQVPTPVTASASLTTATCPGTGCVVLNVSGYNGAAIQLSGTWTGTVTFEGSITGSTYAALTGWTATTSTANGLWLGPVGGTKYLRVRFSTATSGTVAVSIQAALDGTATSSAISGTVAATQSGTWTVQPGNTPNSVAWVVTGAGGTFPATLQAGTALAGETVPVTTATTTDTALTSYVAAAASTNATSVKASAGNVYGYSLSNTTSTLYYLRMYNLAAAPTCSSATGFVESIPIPHASGNGGGRERPEFNGQAFTTGIAYCITGGAGSTDNTNAAVGVFVTLKYK